MLADFHLNKSLQELENCHWDEPECKSHLITTCHRLRKVPLMRLNVEDLRIMIGQNIGLDYLVPLAIKHLHSHPLAHGDFYHGDLLVGLLRVGADFWNAHANYCNEIHEIVRTVLLMGQKKRKRFYDSIEGVKEAYRFFGKK